LSLTRTGGATLSRVEICVVDDVADVRQALRARLEAAGYAVSEAQNGDVALAVILQRQPALAIVDIIMPDREGLSLIEELKERMPKLPIIAISGGGSIGPEDYLQLALEFGADAAFPKPLRDPDFIEAVKRLAPL